MSVIKKMPNEKAVARFRYALWFLVIGVCVAAAYLKTHADPVVSQLAEYLTAILIVGIVFAIVLESYLASHQRCPDCGKRMCEVFEGTHIRAKEYHILYCERCDVLWDTTIPKAND